MGLFLCPWVMGLYSQIWDAKTVLEPASPDWNQFVCSRAKKCWPGKACSNYRSRCSKLAQWTERLWKWSQDMIPLCHLPIRCSSLICRFPLGASAVCQSFRGVEQRLRRKQSGSSSPSSPTRPDMEPAMKEHVEMLWCVSLAFPLFLLLLGTSQPCSVLSPNIKLNAVRYELWLWATLPVAKDSLCYQIYESSVCPMDLGGMADGNRKKETHAKKG